MCDDLIRIKENKSGGTLSIPRYTLSVEQKGTNEEIRHANYEVLTKLVGDSDVIVDLDSSLLNIPISKREDYAREFMENVKQLGVEYKRYKVAASSKPSLLSFVLPGRHDEAMDILTYVPNEVWRKDSFEKIFPVNGVRCHILKSKADADEILDRLHHMFDDEKLDLIKASVFCAICFNSMGITTEQMDLPDLKAILGITE
jgi:hypothetical protein